MKSTAIKYFMLMLFFIGCFTFPLFSQSGDDIHDLLYQRDFDDGIALPWQISEFDETYSDSEIIDGKLVLHVYNGGQDKWDVQIRHRELTMEQGHTYTIKFQVSATASTQIYAKVGTQGPPYNEYWNNNWSNISIPAGETVSVEETFTMTQATDEMVEFAFHVGGHLLGSTPIDIIFDEIHLEDPEYIRPDKEVRVKKDVRVNQHGYFPDAPKKATIVSSSSSPISWSLNDSGGTSVLTGTTTVFGSDQASEDHVHIADFSAFTTTGTGYTLSIDGAADTAVSHPFDISPDIYSKMKYDAFSYFYHNRSGIAIEMPYAGSSEYTRAAGHPSDIMSPAPDIGYQSYSLDVSKGWYDAGDHGKYVVNGGISVWTMMNQYERTLHIAGADKTAYADGAVNIPEQGNGYPDILDETRWQMESMLGFQVPEGYNYAGMAHHKGHDESWTAIPTAPADDTKQRYLRPVSTAATLNLAAIAAQSSRLWAEFDSAFADECLTAAERAWAAALENPAIYAPVYKIGGGPYDDRHVDDEFYWAACELYITTGKAEYKTFIESSEYYLKMPTLLADGEDVGINGVFTWGATQGLGTVSLALVPSQLSDADQMTARTNIQAAADFFLGLIEEQGYRLPLKVREGVDEPGYPWGSNSFLVNDMIVMAYAYDYSLNPKYVDGMTETMDYILGRNAMDQSYITGYGEVPVLNPHHRFWANQTDKSYPLAPAGCLSGGPNSGLEDPIVQGAGMQGTAPQKCFLDDIESWSTNEITINWNAPFAWVTAFLDEERNGEPVLGVTLTAPKNGAEFGAGDILLTASTTGDAASVSFYDDTLLLGTDSSAPFSFNWTNAAAGTYNIKARVIGTDGSAAESAAATITVVDNYKPTVALVTPVDGKNYTLTEEVIISTIAEDLDGAIVSVSFLLNGNPLADITSYPYSYNAGTLAEGAYTITAIAVDNEGAESTPVYVGITVGESNAILLPGTVEVEDYARYYDKSAGNYSGAYRTDDVDIENCGDIGGGFNIAHIDAGEWLEYDVVVTKSGTYTIDTRTARDMAGEGSFSLELDGTDISGTITAPNTNGWQSFETYTKENIVLTEGTYNLRVAFSAGSFNLNWIKFSKVPDELTPPEITLSSAQDGTTIKEGSLITANASASDADGIVERVEFAIVHTNKEGAKAAAVYEDTTPPYSYSIAGVEGSYSITATAYDNDGLSTTAANVINVTVEKEIFEESDLVVQTATTNVDAAMNSIAGKFNIVNKGTTTVDLKDLTIRYYYTKEKEIGQVFNCYWAVIGLTNVHGDFKTEDGKHFLEVSFTGGLVPAGGETGEIQYAVNNADWSNYNQLNDDSFTTGTSFADNKLVELYQNGTQVWPAGGPKKYDPVVTITSPVDGDTFDTGANITIEATATDADGTVSQVVFLNNGALLGAGTKNGSTYSYTIVNAADGVYNLSAVATDNEDRTGTSNEVTVTVGTVVKEFTLTVSIQADGSETKTVNISRPSKDGITSVSGGNGYSKTLTYTTAGTVILSTNDGIKNWSGAVSGSGGSVSFQAELEKSYSVTADFREGGPKPPGDWLYANGKDIVDRNGKVVWITGANWYGYNIGKNIFLDMDNRHLDDTLEQIADRGINLIRIPISTELLNQWATGSIPEASYNNWINQHLNGKNSLEIFDYMIDKCTELGIKIMPDAHSAKTDPMGHMKPLWYDGNITEEIFKSSWVWFANRYKDNDTVIAIDLENEPHGDRWDEGFENTARWDDSNDKNNWKKVAQETALAILAVNPNVLIMVEGIEVTPKDGYGYDNTDKANFDFNWWGGNLRGVKNHPIDLGDFQDKLVYSPHDYGPRVYRQPWFDPDFDKQKLFEECWQPNWFYIYEENIAPLLIGEWGSVLEGADNIKYAKAMQEFIAENKLHHTFWCLNADSNDTGKLLLKSSDGWDEAQYDILAPTLWKHEGKFVGLSQTVNLGSNGTCIGKIGGQQNDEFTLTVSVKAAPGDTRSVTVSPTPNGGTATVSSSQTFTYTAAVVVTLSGSGVEKWTGSVSGTGDSVTLNGQINSSYSVTADFEGGSEVEVIHVEAEDYDNMIGIDVEDCSNGGQNVGWIDEGDWLDYTVNVQKGGFYTTEYRVAGWDSGASLQMVIDGQVYDSVTIPNTGGYQSWTTVESQISGLETGTQTIRILATGPGFNIDWFRLTSDDGTLKYTLTVLPEGETTGSGRYEAGTVVDISYTGSKTFKNWEGTVGNANSANTTVTVNGNMTVTAKTEFNGGDTPVAYYGEMKVNGAYIHGSNTNQPMQVKGMSLFWNQWGGENYFNAATVNDMVDNFKAELIRAPISPDNMNEGHITAVVDQAIERGIYVIIDYHSHHAEDEVSKAQGFFRSMAQKYGQYDNVIFEVYNEPIGEAQGGESYWNNSIKPYAEKIIPVIREHSDNLILVGSPFYASQPVHCIDNQINDSNVAYVFHFYAYSHTPPGGEYVDTQTYGYPDCDKGWAYSNIKPALGVIPVFCTEWGTSHSNGGRDGMEGSHSSTNSDIWWDIMDEYKVSSAMWSIFNDSQASAIYDASGNLKEAGYYIKGKLNEWATQAPWRK